MTPTPHPTHPATHPAPARAPRAATGAAPLDRILSGLRDIAPNPGLEARLLHTLAQRPSPDPSLAARLRRQLAVLPRRWSLAASASLVLVVALAFPHRPHVAVSTHQAHQATRPPVILPKQQSVPDLALVPRRGDTRPRGGRPVPQLRTDELPSDPTALALLETNAPSHPAPPVSTTPEERAFRRFISRHTAVSLAALSPENEPAHEAAAQKDFNTFFPPPPPPELANQPPE